MDLILRVLPSVVLVAYSQIIIKWRVSGFDAPASAAGSNFHQYAAYLIDPYILSACIAGPLGSFYWLFTVSKLPLAQAFPIYQGLVFIAVIVCSASILHEPLNIPKVLGSSLILMGVIIGAQG